MNEKGITRKLLVRAASILMVFAALGILLFPQTPSQSNVRERFSLAPPEETSPEIVAIRGCIEGVGHLSERRLSYLEQVAACNDHVQLAEDRTQAVYFRGLHLYENGTINEHRLQAYRDFTFVIDAGEKSPSAYSKRARLNLWDRDAPELALADIEKAIELTMDRPRSYYFELRALILFQLAERDADEELIYAGLDDIKKAKSLNPESSVAPQLEEWATEFLKSLHQAEGRPIDRG